MQPQPLPSAEEIGPKRQRFLTPKLRSSSCSRMNRLAVFPSELKTDLSSVFWTQGCCLQRYKMPIDSQLGWRAACDVQVRRSLLNHHGQQSMEINIDSVRNGGANHFADRCHAFFQFVEGGTAESRTPNAMASLQFDGGHSLKHEVLEFIGHGHNLVESDSSFEPCIITCTTALPFVDLHGLRFFWLIPKSTRVWLERLRAQHIPYK